MSRYDAVLFDSDGVLVEPPAVETQSAATRAAFRAVGVAEPDRADVRAVVDGVTPGELDACCRRYDVEPEAFWAARERHDEDSQLEAFRAGVRTVYDDVGAIASLSGPRGVVSNNHQTTIDFVCSFFELDSLFASRYGRPMTIESLGRKKPNPYYIERAMADLSAETALYVGDSESDLVAARRAGLDSAFVRRRHNRETALSVEPDYVIDSLTALRSIVGRDG
ncbi:HAD family hydrolase [Halovivax gelatinilyticus]|uniref:HAD family hydrolase n=1 Tax=Halovivax gelatinilyticus TaxID=2961597 RepID=UPI0020CA593C|nr:HAD family hydrolase [Halovivax gelatinilyticus]